MKAIMISIQPKYVADILNGKKTLEIRKTFPKCDLPIDVYIYCTKQKKTSEWAKRNTLCSDVYDGKITGHYQLWSTDIDDGLHTILNGKVVAKFTLNRCEYIYHDFSYPKVEFETDSLKCQALLKKSCLTRQDIEDYIKMDKGYAWHIDNLVVFDKPKELSEFWTSNYNKGAMCDNEPQFPCTKCPNTGALYCNCKFLLNGNCSCVSLIRAPQSWQFIEV